MKPPLKVALFYFLFGFLWILLSDSLINGIFPDTALRAMAQTFKGWLYVVLTTVLLFILIRYYFQEVERKEREKRKVFTSTMRTVHHILNNFLSQMQLFKIEAEASERLDKESLKEWDHVIYRTAEHLKTLGALEHIEPETIEARMLDGPAEG